MGGRSSARSRPCCCRRSPWRFPQAAVPGQVTRGALIETLSEDYIRTARAKGLSEGQTIRRHALRNAMIGADRPRPAVHVPDRRRHHHRECLLSAGPRRSRFQAIAQRDLIVVQGVVVVLVLAAVIGHARGGCGLCAGPIRASEGGGMSGAAIIIAAALARRSADRRRAGDGDPCGGAVVACLDALRPGVDRDRGPAAAATRPPTGSEPTRWGGMSFSAGARRGNFARSSLLATVGIGMLGGVPLGLLAPQQGGWTFDEILTRAGDVILRFRPSARHSHHGGGRAGRFQRHRRHRHLQHSGLRAAGAGRHVSFWPRDFIRAAR